MERLLVVVEGAFDEGRRGVALAPRITVKNELPASFPVRLRLPDGAEREATASLQVAHIRGPNGAFAIVRLAGVAAGEIPAGTEVWMEGGGCP